MIPRILVPRDVRPIDKNEVRKAPRRLETYMDERTVVPSGVSDAPPLDGKTTIPAHLPLGVLVERTLVPRGMPAKAIESFEPIYEHVPLAILDSRVVVPAYVEPAEPGEIEEFVERTPEGMSAERREVVQPDIFTTGDANLLIEPETKKEQKSDLLSRSSSVLVHILLLVFIISIPKLFPAHIPTRQEIELASRQLGVTYISPDEIPKAPPGPKVHINQKVLNKVAPPRAEEHAPAAPPVNPERAPSDLPAAPSPSPSANSLPQPTSPPPSHLDPVLPVPASPGHPNLGLPSGSPGKAIQDQLQDAISHSSGGGTYSTGGTSRGGGGGGGGPGMGGGVQILTDTEGVDFQSYINRLLAVIKRNWYSVMPESALMGDRGIVSLTFQINADGSVPTPDPILERTSGKEPLDMAAMSSIRASNPFEPLPPKFHGPFIRLRITYFYNIPIDYSQ